MKTCVIYSGQARTFGRLFENHYFHVLRKLPNPEFFVSVADDAQAGDMTRLWERFPQESVHIEYVQQPDLPEPPPDPPYLKAYETKATPQAILKQLWALNRAWEFASQTPAGRSCDCMIRIRPDLRFVGFELPALRITHSEWYTPWWSRWGGVNDRFAILGCAAAFQYFNTFVKIGKLMAGGCPLHPETLIYESMRDAGLLGYHRPLSTLFSTLRLDGKEEPPDMANEDWIEYVRSRP